MPRAVSAAFSFAMLKKVLGGELSGAAAALEGPSWRCVLELAASRCDSPGPPLLPLRAEAPEEAAGGVGVSSLPPYRCECGGVAGGVPSFGDRGLERERDF